MSDLLRGLHQAADRRANLQQPPVQSQTRTVRVEQPRPKFSLVVTYDPATDRADMTATDLTNLPDLRDMARALHILHELAIGRIAIVQYEAQKHQSNHARQPIPQSATASVGVADNNPE